MNDVATNDVAATTEATTEATTVKLNHFDTMVADHAIRSKLCDTIADFICDGLVDSSEDDISAKLNELPGSLQESVMSNMSPDM